jgi:DnaJ-class molecular chaperone
MSENHYKTLGVSDKSTTDEIKKAYRKLSLKYHPDKNQGSIEAIQMFQKINEAYEVIGNEEKRREYDMMQKNPFMKMDGFPAGFQGGFHSANNGDIDDLLNNLFGVFPGMSGFPPGMPQGMSFFQTPNVRIFRNGQQVNHMMEKPTPIIKNIIITMEQVYSGAKIPIEVERWIIENNNKVFETITLYIDIFKGIDNNEIIILRDQGNIMNDECKGDIKIFVKVENNTKFERKGLDLIMKHNISLKESLCGFSFEFMHLNGKTYTINNKEGNIIQPNYEKIIPNMGLLRESHVGNMIIEFKIIFPEILTNKQIDDLKNIL